MQTNTVTISRRSHRPQPPAAETLAARLLAQQPPAGFWPESPPLAGETRRAERPLAFMHIPKTAGTSLMKVMTKALHSPRKVRGLDPVLFGSFRGQATLRSPVAERVYPSAGAMPGAADLVMGHFALSTLRQRYPLAQCVTFLREPITRLLSHWVWWRCQSDERLFDWGGWQSYVATARGSLKAFLLEPSVACQTDNVALRMLLWPGTDAPSPDAPRRAIPDAGFLQPEQDSVLLREALARLDSFAHLDVIENPSHLKGFGFWLGVGLASRRLGSNERAPEHLRCRLEEELDDETLALLYQRCRLDLRLWRAIARRHLPGTDLDALWADALNRGLARYSEQLAP